MADARQAERREIDWGSAEVRDHELSVQLDGDSSRAWRARAERVFVQLQRPGSSWGGVEVKRDRLVVTGVPEDAEDELRFFLESVVQEANAAADEPSTGDASGDGSSASEDDDPDARMTETFRAYGEDRQSD